MSEGFELTKESYDSMKRMASAVDKTGEYLSRWVRFSLSKDAQNFADYVKTAWLYGSTIQRQTGKTGDSLKPFVPARWRNRFPSGEVYYAVHPGVGVNGSLNYHGTLAKSEVVQKFKKTGKVLHRHYDGSKAFMPLAKRSWSTATLEQDVMGNIESGIKWLYEKENVNG